MSVKQLNATLYAETAAQMKTNRDQTQNIQIYLTVLNLINFDRLNAQPLIAIYTHVHAGE